MFLALVYGSMVRRSSRFFATQQVEFGVDEAGRGPLAGPVVCAACYLPVPLESVMDSKKFKSEEAREATYAELMSTPGVRYAVAKCEPDVIDSLNILAATLAAMRLASQALCRKLDGEDLDDAVMVCTGDEGVVAPKRRYLALVDGNKDPWAEQLDNLESRPIVGGDASVPSISAASIIAKVTRDRIMNALHDKYPAYDFIKHKGYGTVQHRMTIHEIGWIKGVHRTSFNPVKSLIEDRTEKRQKKRARRG